MFSEYIEEVELQDGIPVVDVGALHVILTFEPTFHVDVAHFLAREERIIFQNYIVRVPNDAAKLIAGGNMCKVYTRLGLYVLQYCRFITLQNKLVVDLQ